MTHIDFLHFFIQDALFWDAGVALELADEIWLQPLWLVDGRTL